MAFEPPPTQAMHASGSRPAWLEDLRAASSPITDWKSRTMVGYGCGPERRAEQVVGVADVGHPVTNRFVDGVLQRASAALDCAHLRAQQPHAEDVRLLAGHVDAAHVDDARQTKQRRHCGSRNPVLARSGLCDEPPLAHARASRAWPSALSIYVRRSEPDPRARDRSARHRGGRSAAASMGQRGGPADVGGQQTVQFGLKSSIGCHGHVCMPPAPAERASTSRGQTGRRKVRTWTWSGGGSGSEDLRSVGSLHSLIRPRTFVIDRHICCSLVHRFDSPATNAFIFPGSFRPGLDSTPEADIHAPRLDGLDRSRDVVGAQSAGEQERPSSRQHGAMLQSATCPLPPNWPGAAASRSKAGRGGSETSVSYPQARPAGCATLALGLLRVGRANGLKRPRHQRGQFLRRSSPCS